MSVLARVAYDGTDFCGFARQPGQPTIQGSLEEALAFVYGVPVVVLGASRTDSGVHAKGQLVVFEPPPEPSIPLAGLHRAVAGRLPDGVMVTRLWAHPGPERARPRFDNGGKRYRYTIHTGDFRDPLRERFEWHLPRDLDLEAMQAAASKLVGAHDFRAFRAADCQAKTTVRRLRSVTVERTPGARVEVDVDGEAFLKNMVRIITGTLVDVGTGRIGSDDIDGIVASGDRTRAGQTAPARGLCLEEVMWDEPSTIAT